MLKLAATSNLQGEQPRKTKKGFYPPHPFPGYRGEGSPGGGIRLNVGVRNGLFRVGVHQKKTPPPLETRESSKKKLRGMETEDEKKQKGDRRRLRRTGARKKTAPGNQSWGKYCILIFGHG